MSETYGGGSNPPVRMDMWQNIINVHWPGFPRYLAIGFIWRTRNDIVNHQLDEGYGPFAGSIPCSKEGWDNYTTFLGSEMVPPDIKYGTGPSPGTQRIGVNYVTAVRYEWGPHNDDDEIWNTYPFGDFRILDDGDWSSFEDLFWFEDPTAFQIVNLPSITSEITHDDWIYHQGPAAPKATTGSIVMIDKDRDPDTPDTQAKVPGWETKFFTDQLQIHLVTRGWEYFEPENMPYCYTRGTETSPGGPIIQFGLGPFSRGYINYVSDTDEAAPVHWWTGDEHSEHILDFTNTELHVTISTDLILIYKAIGAQNETALNDTGFAIGSTFFSPVRDTLSPYYETYVNNGGTETPAAGPYTYSYPLFWVLFELQEPEEETAT